MLIDLVAPSAPCSVVAARLAAVACARPRTASGRNSTSPARGRPLATEDVQNDSVPVDYLGLALTDEGRTRALSYDESQKSMIERQCQGWGASYVVLGPFGLRVSSQTDPVTNRVVSYTIGAWEDWNEMIIWMDGRPRPSEHALHTQAGFTTGRWEGGALAARTTHMKAGFIRKTGVPLTDQATIDWRFFRHGDVLTVLMVATRSGLSRGARDRLEELPAVAERRSTTATRASPGYEGREPGDSVPHFAPDQEPVRRRVHEALPPAARGRARLSRDAVSGVPQEDQGHLRPAAAVHRILRRRRQLRPPSVRRRLDRTCRQSRRRPSHTGRLTRSAQDHGAILAKSRQRRSPSVEGIAGALCFAHVFAHG